LCLGFTDIIISIRVYILKIIIIFLKMSCCGGGSKKDPGKGQQPGNLNVKNGHAKEEPFRQAYRGNQPAGGISGAPGSMDRSSQSGANRSFEAKVVLLGDSGVGKSSIA
jgi:hypothetical protein